jgi:hypothetical protein
MSTSYALIVADNMRPPHGAVIGPSPLGVAEYEAEHSERQASGSVAVGPESWWSGTLAVPMTGDQSLLVIIRREGPAPAGAPSVPVVTLVIPPGEADAVLALVRGLIAQARRDGVLVRRRGRAQERSG